MRHGPLLLLAAVVICTSLPARAQVGKPPPQANPTQSNDAMRRVAPPSSELVESFVEIEPFTDRSAFSRYDRLNKVKIQSGVIHTLKNPGKASSDEARKRSPRVVGQRVKNGVLPVAVWQSTAKTQRVDFLVGGSGTSAVWSAEDYESPAVLAGGDPQGLEQLAQFVNGFRMPVTVRIIYQDGQVWLATFVLSK